MVFNNKIYLKKYNRRVLLFIGSYSSPRLLVSNWPTIEKTKATTILTFPFSSMTMCKKSIHQLEELNHYSEIFASYVRQYNFNIIPNSLGITAKAQKGFYFQQQTPNGSPPPWSSCTTLNTWNLWLMPSLSWSLSIVTSAPSLLCSLNNTRVTLLCNKPIAHM